MKRRRLPPDQHLKRRYNLCHRLRLKGVAVDTDSNAINITGSAEMEALPATALRYIGELKEKYHFVVQTFIPGGQRDGQPAETVKFRRKPAAQP
ncbi:MAG TPA: hypothetical protein PK228_15900 [Saprospiraceae bacterium]|nr:hypothetical protein [Saprospiraceae bacterium]